MIAPSLVGNSRWWPQTPSSLALGVVGNVLDMLLLLDQLSHCIFKSDVPFRLGNPMAALALYLICCIY